ELRAVTMPPRQLVGEDEADGALAVERHEHQRPRIGEQPLRIARALIRGELPQNVLVTRREQANRDFRDGRWVSGTFVHAKEDRMPGKRAAKISNSPGASSRGGKAS